MYRYMNERLCNLKALYNSYVEDWAMGTLLSRGYTQTRRFAHAKRGKANRNVEFVQEIKRLDILIPELLTDFLEVFEMAGLSAIYRGLKFI